MGSSFGYESRGHTRRERVSIGDFCSGECILRDVVRISCIFFFSLYFRYIVLVP